MNAKITTQSLLATLAIATVAGTSSADITSSSPTANVAAGTNMAPNLTHQTLENSSAVWVFRERIGYELDSVLKLDVTATGTGGAGDLSIGSVGPGDVVKSYFVHFDPEGTNAVTIAGGFQLSSDEEIIGLIFSDDRMGLADSVVGRDTVTYPTAFASRGYDDNNDLWTISADRHTFQFEMRAAGGGLDQIRVITRTVPAPGALAMCGLGGLIATKRRRTK